MLLQRARCRRRCFDATAAIYADFRRRLADFSPFLRSCAPYDTRHACCYYAITAYAARAGALP